MRTTPRVVAAVDAESDIDVESSVPVVKSCTVSDSLRECGDVSSTRRAARTSSPWPGGLTMGNQPPLHWPVDGAFQVLRRQLDGDEVARGDLESTIHTVQVRLLRWDTSVPGWEYDPPQTVSADAARLTRLRLDEGHAIILTRDPSGRPAECILNGETWYYNGNLHYVIPYDDFVARWPIFAQALDQEVAAVSAPTAAGLTAKPEGVSPRVWAVAGLLDKLDQSRGSSDAGIAVSELLKSVKDIAPKGISVSETTLREARRFRKDRAAYCRQRTARKRKTRRRRA